jgi:NAD(P)-dependent dehydrogenase (short-subunit alcohol dehydrogenase family)
MKKILKNKNILVTGGSLGLGYELAKFFINQGANVIICSRNKLNLKNARRQLQIELSQNQKLIAIKADLSRERDIKRLYDQTLKKFKFLDVLVSNAGVYGPKGSIINTNWINWKKSFEINCFGSIYLIKTFIKLLRKSRRGKIIQLSGGGATSPLPNLSCYAASKAAVVRFAETISFELANFNIDINCVAPGALNTRLLDEILRAGPKRVGKKFYDKSIQQKKSGGAGYSYIIKLIKFLCSQASNGITGKLISAQWDNYEMLAKKKRIINNDSDVFTLRRIVGKDRKLKFLDK